MAGDQEQIRNIWMLSREYGQLAGAGGVKDVSCQLAEALASDRRCKVQVVLPLYGFLNPEELGFSAVADPLVSDKVLSAAIDMNQPDRVVREEVHFFEKEISKVKVYLIDAERYRQKSDVYVYTEADEKRLSWQKKSKGHHDYFAMNLLLQKAALELMILLDQKPDVIHCHDGHTALLPALIREIPGYRSYFRNSGCLVTIHNAGYGYHQEIADNLYAQSITDLPAKVIYEHQLERKFDPFLAAGHYATLNTVSENYAKELQETESDELTGWVGHELKDRNVIIEGITNGITPEAYSPALLAKKDKLCFYDPADKKDDLSGKAHCKEQLLTELSDSVEFEDVKQFGRLQKNSQAPLFTFIGRLSQQKGVDRLAEVVPVFMQRFPQVQILVLGSGETELEKLIVQLTQVPEIQGRLCYLQGFSPHLANRVYAAGDFFIVPSNYEPCGLTDLIAQCFGNIPVVHQVGGLVKVLDGVTGIGYQGAEPEKLLEALERAVSLCIDPRKMRNMQFEAVEEIKRNYTWSKVKMKYIELYKKARNSQLV